MILVSFGMFNRKLGKLQEFLPASSFLLLLTWSPPNLVEIKEKQNKLQIFIDNPLIYENFMEKKPSELFWG